MLLFWLNAGDWKLVTGPFLILMKWEYNEICQLTVCSCHVTYAFQSESTLYSCLNVKELLAWSRRKIWRWSDCNWTRIQNHLVLKRTLNTQLSGSGFDSSCSQICQFLVVDIYHFFNSPLFTFSKKKLKKWNTGNLT